ncbi:hypothetical protein VRRI112168_17480 [Vreelandella rituensis]
MLVKGKAPKVLIAVDGTTVGRSRLQTFPRGDRLEDLRHQARKGNV